jgi:hypothetical protein
MPFEKAGVLKARNIIKELPEQPTEVPSHSHACEAWAMIMHA